MVGFINVFVFSNLALLGLTSSLDILHGCILKSAGRMKFKASVPDYIEAVQNMIVARKKDMIEIACPYRKGC